MHKKFIKKCFLMLLIHYKTILYYSLYMNDYTNIDISLSSISGIPPILVHNRFKLTFTCLKYKQKYFTFASKSKSSS